MHQNMSALMLFLSSAQITVEFVGIKTEQVENPTNISQLPAAGVLELSCFREQYGVLYLGELGIEPPTF